MKANARMTHIFLAVLVTGLIGTAASAQVYTPIHDFSGPDGANPYAGLILGSDGYFYGTTEFGGANGWGTVFKMSSLGEITTLHSFNGSVGDAQQPRTRLLQATDSYFYGTTPPRNSVATAYRVDHSGNYTTLNDSLFEEPSAFIQAMDGKLYATVNPAVSRFGCPCGLAFTMDTTGSVATVHTFLGKGNSGHDPNDGSHPLSGLIQVADGSFYGTTDGTIFNPTGDPSWWPGTFFRMDSAGEVTTLAEFATYSKPSAPVQGSDGHLYFTTSAGDGAVYGADSTGNLVVLYTFSGSDGSQPVADLAEGTDAYLYGVTSGGGLYGNGTVFKIDGSGNIATLYAFFGSESHAPSGRLLQTGDGGFYGTTHDGGPGGSGGVFRLQAPFVVGSIAPTSGPAAGGTPVTVAGVNFDPADAIWIARVAASGIIVVSDTQIDAATPALLPGTLNDVTVSSPTSVPSQIPKGFLADFLDVPGPDIFHDYVERIFRSGVTAGCGNGYYCRDNPVRRDQMAVFLLKAEHGFDYVPPACTSVFPDVTCPGPFTDWVEQLAAEGVTAGCGGGNYCPANPVTRAQMAAFLLKTEHGSSYTPPACAGIFGDVPCPSQFADWIEQLAAEQITGGCGNGNYCPDSPNTRGQMAVFLVKTFGLQ